MMRGVCVSMHAHAQPAYGYNRRPAATGSWVTIPSYNRMKGHEFQVFQLPKTENCKNSNIVWKPNEQEQDENYWTENKVKKQQLRLYGYVHS